MFVRKLILALALIPPFFSLWWFGAPYFSSLMVVFAAVAAFEVAAMATGPTPARRTAALAAVPGAIAIAYTGSFIGTGAMSLALLGSVLWTMTVHLFSPGDMTSVGSRTSASLLAAAYGGAPIVALVWLRDVPEFGRSLALVALGISWLCDTFAYIGGSLLGKRKLYPQMSPNKTVEGLLTGMIAAGLGVAGYSYGAGLPWHPAVGFILGFVGGGIGQIGDLCESMLKRSYGVKDSGALLGSHGGVLDRFDAVLFVAPFVYAVWSGAQGWHR